MKRKIIHVDWVDSAACHGWQEPHDNGLEKIETVGYLVRQTKKFLAVTSSLGENGRMICTLAIPLGCITRKSFMAQTKVRKRKKTKR